MADNSAWPMRPPVLSAPILDRLAGEAGWPKRPDGSLVPLDTLAPADAYVIIDGMMRRVQALLADPRMQEKIAHVCAGGPVQ